MNCDSFKNKISQRVGSIFLGVDEKEHLELCPECKNLYENYVALEKGLNDLVIEPLGAVEFAAMQQKLDDSINRYQRRAISFYSLATRYGAGLVAVAFLFFVSLWSGFEFGVYYSESNNQSDIYYLADNGDIEDDEDESMNEEYIELLLYDYTESNGFNSGDMLLGDLTLDELEYLENNLDAGDIL